MPLPRLILYTTCAMLAFAGNSILGRMALREGAIDAASYTTIRMLAGAIMLALVAMLRGGDWRRASNWTSAGALMIYAAAFSFAYVELSAGMGALLLFGGVQGTMILTGLWFGERLTPGQWLGLAAAIGGLVYLLSPGAAAPPWLGATLMITAGIAWGVYSLRGRSNRNPIAATAGNFLRAAPLAVALGLAMAARAKFSAAGLAYAAVSGAITSGLGYVIWYQSLRGLTATRAAAVQLSVPVFTALGGVAFLGETMTTRLAISSIAILSGIALVIFAKRRT